MIPEVKHSFTAAGVDAGAGIMGDTTMARKPRRDLRLEAYNACYDEFLRCQLTPIELVPELAMQHCFRKHISGPLSAAVEWTLGRSPRQQPELAGLAWLSAFSSLMRGYRTPTGLRSNLCIVGVAPSGSGKDSARKAIVEAFSDAGALEHIGGEAVASDAGLLGAVREHPGILFPFDEFGHMFRGFVDPRAPAYLRDIATTLTKLFTSSGGTFLGTEYSDRKLRKREPIVEPCVSIYGTATHSQFYQRLHSSKIDDGTISRFLVYDAGDRIPGALSPLELDYAAPTPPAVVNAIQRIRERAAAAGEMSVNSRGRPGAITLKLSRGAELKFNELSAKADAWAERGPAAARPMLARLVEMATKVALVHAVACDPEATQIKQDSAEFGELVAINSVGTILQGNVRFASENDREAREKRLLERIRVAGARGMNTRNINRACRGLSQRDRVDLITSLEEAGDIFVLGPMEGRLGRTPKATYVHRDYVPAPATGNVIPLPVAPPLASGAIWRPAAATPGAPDADAGQQGTAAT